VSDVDWGRRLLIERGIVEGHTDDVKTSGSRKWLVIDGDLLASLREWKQVTQFAAEDDWFLASPAKLGRGPWRYNHVWTVYRKAGSPAPMRCDTHTERGSIQWALRWECNNA